MKGGPRKKGTDARSESPPDPAPGAEEALQDAEHSRKTGAVDLEDLQDLLREGLRDLREARKEHRREVEQLQALQAELRDQFRLKPAMEEFDAAPGARALEQVELLRQNLADSPRLDRLAADLEESRKAWRQSSQAAAAVVGRLETRMDDLAARVAESGAPREAADQEAPAPELVGELRKGLEEVRSGLEAFRETLGGLEGRLEALGGLKDRLDSLEGRLEQELPKEAGEGGDVAAPAALPADLAERLEALGSGLRERVDSLEESHDSFGERLASYVETVEDRVRDGLAAMADRLETLEEKAGAGTPMERLDRLERETRRLAERLDEELDAVFEQNRQRVGEMTESFNDGMIRLEEAVARVERLEEATSRSTEVAHGAAERLELLTGQLGRLEDQVVQAPAGDLEHVVTELRTRMDYLESTPRPSPAGGPGRGGPQRTPLRDPGIDPEEGLAAPVDAATVASVQAAPPVPAAPPARPAPAMDADLLKNVTETVERLNRDLELRLVDQSLEAVTEAQLLREEFERLAGDVGNVSEQMGRQLALIWRRLEGLDQAP